MGHAMQHLLQGRHRLAIHDSRAVDGLAPIDLGEEAAKADFVLMCVPAQPHQALLDSLLPLLPAHCICLSIAKGLDDLGRTPAQIYADTAGDRQPWCLLYGPMISEEIRADRPAFAELGCADEAVFARVRDLYAGTRLHLRHNTDITGISWSVILKNVYAIGFGMADGLGLGDNVRGFLVVTAMEELRAIVTSMGGVQDTPLQLAGLGDLVTTATSAGSHHHEIGLQLAAGETGDIGGEGVHTLAMVDEYGLFDSGRYPLYSLIHDVVGAPAEITERFQGYIDRVCG